MSQTVYYRLFSPSSQYNDKYGTKLDYIGA